MLRHEPGPCVGCGAGLSEAPEVGVECRQVFDLSPVRVRVIEHQLVARCRGCGVTTYGDALRGVRAPVQYRSADHRPRPQSVWGRFLSKERTARALAELGGIPVCDGTVASMTRRGADGLDGLVAEV